MIRGTHPPRTRPALLAVVATALASLAATCGEPTLNSNFALQVAVTAGDFDDVAAPFKRGAIAHDVFEGIISNATWDEDFNPGGVALKVEDLFIGASGAGQLGSYGAVFVGSGTRGFGGRQYNGLDPDNTLISDERVVDNTLRYVSSGDTLVVTDWAYELVEAGWPEMIEWAGDEMTPDGTGWANLDAAQMGMIDRITAEVSDAELAQEIGPSMAVDFPYSNFAVIESVSDDVTVYVRGDVAYRPDELSEPIELTDVPLLVGFDHGDGRVLFSTFHIDAQNPALMDTLIETLVGRFEVENTNVQVQ